MGFNSGFKGLNTHIKPTYSEILCFITELIFHLQQAAFSTLFHPNVSRVEKVLLTVWHSTAGLLD